MTECKNLSKPRWANLLISMVTNFLFWWTKQIFFLDIKLEPGLLSRLQPRINNCVPTELDVSISASKWQCIEFLRAYLDTIQKALNSPLAQCSWLGQIFITAWIETSQGYCLKEGLWSEKRYKIIIR
jgi:hypothetical protein